MVKKSLIHVAIILLILICAYNTVLEVSAEKITIFGKVLDSRNETIKDAKIRVYVNEKLLEESLAEDGIYHIEIDVKNPKNVVLEFSKPGYENKRVQIEEFIETEAGYLVQRDVYLLRKINAAFFISAFVLILIYILISFEIVHRATAALLGASLLLFITYTLGTFNEDFFIISFEAAIHHIDFNVIFLLLGMMMIVTIMKETGVFQWTAYKAYQLANGDPWKLIVILMVVTATAVSYTHLTLPTTERV